MKTANKQTNFETELKNLGVRLDAMVSAAKVKEIDVKADYQSAVTDLETKYRAAQLRFKEAREAGGEKGDILMGGFEEAWADLTRAFGKISD